MWKKTPHNRLELETYCRVNTTRPCFKGKPGSANYYSVCNCIFPGLYGACFFFFYQGFTSCKAEQPPQGMQLQEKEAQKY